MDIKNYLEQSISFKTRKLISIISGIFFFVGLWGGLFLTSYLLTHNHPVTSRIVSIALVVIVPLSLIVGVSVSPSVREQTQEKLKDFLNNINNANRRIKIRKINNFIRELNNLNSLSNFGFNKKVREYFKDYTSYILYPLIFSSNQKVIAVIHEELSKITDFRDSFLIYQCLTSLHIKIIKFKEFSNLRVVYPSLDILDKKKKSDVVLVINIIAKDNPPKPHIMIWNFLKEYGLVKPTVIALGSIILIWILTRMGLFPNVVEAYKMVNG